MGAKKIVEPSIPNKKKLAQKGLSVTVYPLGLGGSNGERLEIEAIFGSPYNAASYGISLTTSPYQADIILLYGSLTEKLAPLVYRLLISLPQDVKLIAVGSETLSTSPFRLFYGVAGPFLEPQASKSDTPNTSNPDQEHLPISNETKPEGSPVKTRGVVLPEGLRIAGFIAGSPPDPQSILDGILQTVFSKI